MGRSGKPPAPKWLDENEMPVVDLTTYDWIVVNTSAGKDSQAMLSELLRRCDELDIPRARIVAVHADLGRVEWQGTKELAQKQAEILGVRFMSVSRPEGDLLHQVEFQRRMWPASKYRYCTSDQKRGQVLKVLTKLAMEARRIEKKVVRILNCLGIRAQESSKRATKTPFERNVRASGKETVKVVDEYFPIFDWTVDQVWAEIARSGLPHHFAYDLGMTRLSCVFCVFAPKAMLMIAGSHNRELLEEYVAVEARIGHTFRDGFKIADVKDALDRGETAGVIADEDVKCWDM